MKRIVLPGYGTPVTMTVKEDSIVGVRANGQLLSIHLTANVPTRIEFLKTLSGEVALAA